MSDTLRQPQVSTAKRGAVLAAWATFVALWVAPFFVPFRGFQKGFVWSNPLSSAVLHADCGLAHAPFPNTCTASVNGAEPNEKSILLVLNSRLARARVAGGAALIDDLESNDLASDWFAVNDGKGLQFPTPCAIRSALNGERGSSNAWAMHTYGRSTAGFQWAQIGRNLVPSSERRQHQSIDARGFSGVRFWAKGLGQLRFAIGTVVTTGVDNGGTCRQQCYDNHQATVDLTPAWAQYAVPFATMVQQGFGAPADFDPSQIVAVVWAAADPTTGVSGMCFDFWVDDVAFYR